MMEKVSFSVSAAAALFAAAAFAELAVIPKPAEMRETGGVYKGEKITVSRDAALPAEGYRLKVSENGIEIVSSGDAGEFYARQTLKQLMVNYDKREDEESVYTCAEIADAPKYRWRGLMLDDARHFFGKETVKAFIDRLVEHKFNIFHWHLVDDQGWRLEIKSHPELVEYGAVRPCSVKYGTHPSWPDGKLHFELNNEPYGPFYYTQDDIREILAYAKERHVTVVPEIELPGHVRAMLAAHPEYSCKGDKLPRVPRVYWSIEDDVLCAGNDGGIRLLEEIFDEVCELFPDSPVIHIGGDECPKKRWKECPKCQARMRELGLKDEGGLQAWLTTRFARYLEAKGRRVLGWDEILSGDVPASTIGMSWRTARHGRGVMTAGEAARRGHDVVCTPNS
ncbi:MAG: beta-N-acetylhexosaminidase, partial [Kiritimatiellae bacterium]|nr:beta-N-acetylhexosaminidase [Kiritimatiellia bacterium]